MVGQLAIVGVGSLRIKVFEELEIRVMVESLSMSALVCFQFQTALSVWECIGNTT